MRKIFGLTILLILFTNCKTVLKEDKKPEIYLDNIVSEVKINSYNKESDNSFLGNDINDTQKKLEDEYDLTVLKGGVYPKIINDTPFTTTELEILNRSDDFEIKANLEVAHYFKYFLRDKKELLQLWINNAQPYISSIRKLILINNLPEDLLYLPFLESGYNTSAYSRVGAGGIWQFMPSTAQSYGLKINWWIDERRDPLLATNEAIKHLKYLYNLFGDWYTALAAYNAGEGRISRALEKAKVDNYFALIETSLLSSETNKYVIQLMAIIKIMKNLEILGLEPISFNLDNNYETLLLPGGTDLIDLVNFLEIDMYDFKKLNPSFKRNITDPSNDSEIRVPINLKSKAITFINSNQTIKNNGFTYYTVKKGNTWSYLSMLSNTSIIKLKRLNNISSNILYIGQKIMIPKSNNTYITESNGNMNLQEYIVKPGDTMSSISIKFNIKLVSLFKENGLNSKSIIHSGQKIKLPGYYLDDSKVKYYDDKNYYTVEYGDSVWLIAQKTKIPYSRILDLNNLNKNSKLQIGEKILLY